MTDILNKIIATKKQEIIQYQSLISIDEIKLKAQETASTRPFLDAIKDKISQNKPTIIAEIKKASPSKGLIRSDFDPTKIAIAYENGGAACLSVLTDKQYFQGNEIYLEQARSATNLPVLRKDFIIDEYQIYQARTRGADAILLIAAALDEYQLQQFEAIAHSLRMTVLLEVHDQSELVKCKNMQTKLVGVNNRNLRTFDVNLKQTIELLPFLKDKIVVTESGIGSREDIQRMQKFGVNAFLIGETFMRCDDIENAIRSFI